LFIATGVILYLKANIIPMPAEGCMLAIQSKTGIEFHRIKMFFDIFMIITATLLSLFLLKGLNGIGIGTLIAAIFVGKTVGFMEKIFKPHIDNLVTILNT
jgi:uncharacterized membrane protein YczE